jgi:hypothetical protein
LQLEGADQLAVSLGTSPTDDREPIPRIVDEHPPLQCRTKRGHRLVDQTDTIRPVYREGESTIRQPDLAGTQRIGREDGDRQVASFELRLLVRGLADVRVEDVTG